MENNQRKNLKEVKNFTDLEMYQLAEDIALRIEKLCRSKESLSKMWKQVDHLIESAVSMGANIAEGFGRYFFKENINFLYYSRGSLCETIRRLRHLWLSGYLTEGEVKDIFRDLERLNVKINNSISSTRAQFNNKKLQ